MLGLALTACTAASPEPERSEPSPSAATPSAPSTPEPIAAPALAPGEALTDVIALSQSRYPHFACALRRAGRVACWGNNEWGQLGQGHYDAITGAVEVRGLHDAVAIATASSTACAVRRSGEVVCWGDNHDGELGLGHELAHAGLVTIPEVRGAEQLFSRDRLFCATTATAPWCWGRNYADLRGERAPRHVTQQDVTALMLGERTLARLRDGRMTVLDFDAPALDPEVVDAHVDGEQECLVAADGRVTCKLRDSDVARPIDALKGARAIAFGHKSGDLVGLLPDGSLKVVTDEGGERVLEGARDITLLASVGTPILAATRTGRVLEWKDAGPASEIVLPPLGSEPRERPRPTGPVPDFCSIEVSSVMPELVGPLASRQDACESLGLAPDSASCPKAGPWLGLVDDIDIVLELAQGDQLARIPAPVRHSEGGTEEADIFERWLVRSSSPLDVWLRVESQGLDCADEEMELCSLRGMTLFHVVMTGLERGDVLVTVFRINLESMGYQERNRLDPILRASTHVEVRGELVDVWGCGSHTTLPLPPRGGSSGGDEAPSPTEPPASADEAAAAGKRCGAGWTLFKAGDLAGAKLEIDAALALLERATNERGRKSLGACLYNRGRVAEQEGDPAAARDYYRRSLDVRPNATVEERLASLDSEG
jgi:hypothetical protein